MVRRTTLLALVAAGTTTPVHAIPREFVTTKDAVCARGDLLSCPSDLPSGFCCPAKTKCQSLAGGTTALCCPDGSACGRIQPIACDVSLQDPKENPDATVLTSVFDVKLQVCDNGCCPFGYTCADKVAADGEKSSAQCVRDDDQSKKPGSDDDDTSSTTTATTATTSATKTATATASHTTPAEATASPTDGADSEKGMKSKTMSIIGGVVGGSLVLLILVIVAVLYARRRNSTRAEDVRYEKSLSKPRGGAGGAGARTGTAHSGSSSSSQARALNISEPIVQQGSYRTDFILKSPSAMSSISNQPVNSRWSGSTNAGGRPRVLAGPGARASAALRRGLSRTPRGGAGHKHLSIPNPFASPDAASEVSPKRGSMSSSSFDEGDDRRAKTGHVVGARLAPIRNMRASTRRVSRHTEPQHVRREASEESINVFADANAVPRPEQQMQHDEGQGYQNYRQQQQGNRDVCDEKNRLTTFSDLMEKADLGDIHRGTERYVPGTTPRV